MAEEDPNEDHCDDNARGDADERPDQVGVTKAWRDNEDDGR